MTVQVRTLIYYCLVLVSCSSHIIVREKTAITYPTHGKSTYHNMPTTVMTYVEIINYARHSRCKVE